MIEVMSKQVPYLTVAHYEHLSTSGISNAVMLERSYESVLENGALKDAGLSKT